MQFLGRKTAYLVKLWVSSSMPHKTDVGVLACNSCVREAQGGGLPQPMASMGYTTNTKSAQITQQDAVSKTGRDRRGTE